MTTMVKLDSLFTYHGMFCLRRSLRRASFRLYGDFNRTFVQGKQIFPRDPIRSRDQRQRQRGRGRERREMRDVRLRRTLSRRC